MATAQRTLKVVDRVETGDDALQRMTTLLPEVVLMVSESSTPTMEFRNAVLKLSRARFTDRAVMMVKSPAEYFRLALKSGVAVLMHCGATGNELLTACREIRASHGEPLVSLLQQPSVKTRPQRPN